MRRSYIVLSLLLLSVLAIAAVPQVKDGAFYPFIKNPGFEDCYVEETEDGPMPMPNDWTLSGGAMIIGQPGETEGLGVAGNVCVLFHRSHSRVEQTIQVKPGVVNVITVLLRPMHGATRRTIEAGYISDQVVTWDGKREKLSQSLLTPYHPTNPESPWGNSWAYQEFRFIPTTSQGTFYLQGDCGAAKIIRPVIVY